MKYSIEIGKIVDAIDKNNLWENTVVIFSSDHGDGIGAHHWNQKSALYEEVVNIPFIVTLPGKKHAGTKLPQFSDESCKECTDTLPYPPNQTAAPLSAHSRIRLFQFLMLRRIRLLRLPLVEPFRLSLLSVCQNAVCFLIPVCQEGIRRTALFGFFCTVLPVILPGFSIVRLFSFPGDPKDPQL